LFLISFYKFPFFPFPFFPTQIWFPFFPFPFFPFPFFPFPLFPFPFFPTPAVKASVTLEWTFPVNCSRSLGQPDHQTFFLFILRPHRQHYKHVLLDASYSYACIDLVNVKSVMSACTVFKCCSNSQERVHTWKHGILCWKRCNMLIDRIATDYCTHKR